MTEIPEKQGLPEKPFIQTVSLDPSSPTAGSIARSVLLALIILAVWNFVLGIVGSITQLLFLVVLAIFFAYLIEPLVQMIRRLFVRIGLGGYMPRTLAIAAAYLLVFSILGIGIASIAPRVAAQAKLLAANLPVYVASLQNGFKGINQRYQNYQIPEQYQDAINDKLSETVSYYGGELTTTLGTLVVALVSYLPWLVLIPILAFFFLRDANLFRLSLLRVFPSGGWRVGLESILHDVNKTLAAYVRALLISCLLIGFICTIGFYSLGLNYALLLGILAMAFEFIPLIGPLTLGLLAVTVAGVSQSASTAVYVAFFLIILRILQDYVFYPRIIRGGIHLHPLAIILSVLAGEAIAGIPGVFLAIPIIALLTVIYRNVLEHTGSRGLIANILAPKEAQVDAALPAEHTV